jgi:3-deoxy-7-phosphoheptulonate synthase
MIVEVHPNPAKAWSDGEQSLDFAAFDEMMADLEPWLAVRDIRPPSRRKTAQALSLVAVG